MKNGFIKLYRKFTEWEWYTDTSTKVVFLHLLLMANWEPKRWRGILIDRGQLVTSVENIAVKTGLTVRNVRTALDHLKVTGEVTSKATNKWTLITIEKYSDYQGCDNESDKQSDKQADKRLTTTKEYKKNKKDKNYTSTTYLCQNVADLYNQICVSLPRMLKLTDKRKAHIKARLKEHTLDEIKQVFLMAEESDFLSGRQKDWQADFDWLTKSETNFVKVLEGHYQNRDVKKDKYIADLRKIAEGVTREEFEEVDRLLQ